MKSIKMGNVSLDQLDETVWYIRRYCTYLRGKTKESRTGKEHNFFEYNIERIQNKETIAKPHTFSLMMSGVLEKFLMTKNQKQESNLYGEIDIMAHGRSIKLEKQLVKDDRFNLALLISAIIQTMNPVEILHT